MKPVAKRFAAKGIEPARLLEEGYWFVDVPNLRLMVSFEAALLVVQATYEGEPFAPKGAGAKHNVEKLVRQGVLERDPTAPAVSVRITSARGRIRSAWPKAPARSKATPTGSWTPSPRHAHATTTPAPPSGGAMKASDEGRRTAQAAW